MIHCNQCGPAELSGVYTDDEMGSQEFLDRPTEPADMSTSMQDEANTIIDEILGCKTIQELDKLSPKLNAMNVAQKKAVRPIYDAHRATLLQRENNGKETSS